MLRGDCAFVGERFRKSLPLHRGICMCATNVERISQSLSKMAKFMFNETFLSQYEFDDTMVVVAPSRTCQINVVAYPTAAPTREVTTSPEYVSVFPPSTGRQSDKCPRTSLACASPRPAFMLQVILRPTSATGISPLISKRKNSNRNRLTTVYSTTTDDLC